MVASVEDYDGILRAVEARVMAQTPANLLGTLFRSQGVEG